MRDMERKRAYDRERDLWRTVARRFGKVMAMGGMDVIVRADRVDAGWRDAA